MRGAATAADNDTIVRLRAPDSYWGVRFATMRFASGYVRLTGNVKLAMLLAEKADMEDKVVELQSRLEAAGMMTDFSTSFKHSEDELRAVSPLAALWLLFGILYNNITSLYGSSCANNDKGALNSPDASYRYIYIYIYIYYL